MKKKLLPIVFILLCANAAAPGVQAPDQTAVAPAAAFPKELLEGAPDFSLALLLQGDIRGNFGPCG